MEAVVLVNDGLNIHDPVCISHCDELDKGDDRSGDIDESLNNSSDGHRMYWGFIKLIANIFNGICYLLLLIFDECRVGYFKDRRYNGWLSLVMNVE